MKPDIWGPHAWIFLHSVTMDYPHNPTEKDKENMINFIFYLGKVLPCEKCRRNFQMHLEKNPLNSKALSSKDSLVKWMIDIHNCVNDTKKCKKITHDEGIRKILEHYENKSINYIYILTVVIILFLVILGYMFLQ
ncbi:disulfide thiol oxidoreductase, Erv1 / Alr family [Indivirus ILV1]|uniref:Sulfhydryl oxidase n=1 Tax=Indivirus ILV1 TaxID=1977633 RepID=A0A1V0SDM5_9VIRU|nr:disulfide thiol oxidoreductase, Erv1 / Alr family [Indivirus ILV1]